MWVAEILPDIHAQNPPSGGGATKLAVFEGMTSNGWPLKGRLPPSTEMDVPSLDENIPRI